MPDPLVSLIASTAVSSLADHQAAALVAERGLTHFRYDGWQATDGEDVLVGRGGLIASNVSGDEREGVYDHPDGIVHVRLHGGMIGASAYARTPEAAEDLRRWAREAFPEGDPTSDPDYVRVSFWTYSPHGPRRLIRRIDVEQWEEVRSNYPTTPLDPMFAEGFKPGHGGQLLLWHGEPGTGKTTALRALAHEWRGWCDLHYVVDPERFFGEATDYMIEVMVGEDEEYMPAEDEAKAPRWRLLVLEDCGEMLAADARREVGQALSRLLNVCDGLIGRGLRVMILVTTNEPVGRLHDAVARPGRCAANVQFERFTLTQADAWLEARGLPAGASSQPTLAELYGELEGFEGAESPRPVGFGA